MVDCDCSGTIHLPLSNCLGCGLIRCRESGPGNCTACGSYVGESRCQSDLDRLLHFMLTGSPYDSPYGLQPVCSISEEPISQWPPIWKKTDHVQQKHTIIPACKVSNKIQIRPDTKEKAEQLVNIARPAIIQKHRLLIADRDGTNNHTYDIDNYLTPDQHLDRGCNHAIHEIQAVTAIVAANVEGNRTIALNRQEENHVAAMLAKQNSSENPYTMYTRKSLEELKSLNYNLTTLI